MSEVTNTTETQPVEGTAASAEAAPVKAERARVREALGVLKRHPLGLVVAIGAAAALVEIELAVGILTGVGATALLATKSGPDARQEVLNKGQEVFTKGKAALERARVALTTRAKSRDAEPAATATAATAPEATATAAGPASDPVTVPQQATAPKGDEPPPAAAS